MAQRNLIHESIILRSRESPAGDRIVTLLTAESGLVDAFVFGGPKSKLRSIASPYVMGRAFIYFDPVRDFRKLTDFDVSESNTGLRESLKKLWSAGLIAEILLKTAGGGGDFAHIHELTSTALTRLSSAGEKAADYPLLLFLWRLVAVLGLGPDPESCVACGRSMEEVREAAGRATSLRPRTSPCYSAEDEGFLCPACSSGDRAGDRVADSSMYARTSLIPLSFGALRWIEKSDRSSFDDALGTGLDSGSLEALRALVFALCRRAAETPIISLERGML